jgi:hypothetical protein
LNKNRIQKVYRNMTRHFLIGTCVVGMAAGQVALAIPNLQLDIAGGGYRDETTFANANVFTLNALNLGTSSKTPITDTYYISAALLGAARTTPAPALGSFDYAIDLNGNGRVDDDETSVRVAVAAGMTWGVPPIDRTPGTADSGDLQTHSVFPAYYTEFQFKFSRSLKTTAYDVETGSHPTLPAGTDGHMYYMPILVDVSGLALGYGIHFDLYSKQYSKKGSTDLDVNQFAPFSHDATGMSIAPPRTSVPVPDGGTTALLLGMATLGLGFFRRK